MNTNTIRELNELMPAFDGYYEDIDDEKIITLKKDIRKFDKWLTRQELADATVKSYVRTVKHYFTKYNSLNRGDLLKYKQWMIDQGYAPKTINQRINGLNKYCIFCSRKSLRLNTVKVQQAHFLQNVISFSDYTYFISQLKKDNDLETYFLVKFISNTGARVSELIKFEVKHVYAGHMDIYSKGNKYRRLYIPKRLQTEAIKWIKEKGLTEGLLFRNSRGLTIGTTGVSYKLKKAAKRYKRLNLDDIYPHSFRHLFAINFLEKKNDMYLLADLLGHSSLEVTRIYTRWSAQQQKELLDQIVTW